MIVCHCKGLTDRDIRQAVRDGARTVRQVGRASGLTRACGGCAPVIAELIERESEQHVLPTVTTLAAAS